MPGLTVLWWGLSFSAGRGGGAYECDLSVDSAVATLAAKQGTHDRETEKLYGGLLFKKLLQASSAAPYHPVMQAVR